jgi:hypothetical protein
MEQHEASGAMSRLRILVLGPDCHPTRVSFPYVAYSHAAALAQLHDVTLVALPHVEDDLRRAGAPFRAIEVVRMPSVLQGLHDSLVRRVRPESQIKTALGYPFAMAFEWQAWRQLRHRIAAREFDVVLRVLPMSAVVPSPFARFLRKGPVPFVIGPLNGGLPWPEGFSQIEKTKTWIAGFRDLYHYLPFARSTYGVCGVSRQSLFYPGARHRPLRVFRRFAKAGTSWPTSAHLRWRSCSLEGLRSCLARSRSTSAKRFSPVHRGR